MLKRFADVAVDPATVVAVSNLMENDGESSTMIVSPVEGREVVVYISAAAADSLLDHFGTSDT